MTLSKAIKLIIAYYKQAKTTNAAHPGYIKDPVALALYMAWQDAVKRR